ncbi:MAG: RNA-binding protein [Candidatus Aminicenantes bacterium]|nr:RNA-binding protein [Candidatus Aminicenantes bacterium]
MNKSFPKNSTEVDLIETFAAYGAVQSVAIIKDKRAGNDRGIGFVEMPNKDEEKSLLSDA